MPTWSSRSRWRRGASLSVASGAGGNPLRRPSARQTDLSSTVPDPVPHRRPPRRRPKPAGRRVSDRVAEHHRKRPGPPRRSPSASSISGRTRRSGRRARGSHATTFWHCRKLELERGAGSRSTATRVGPEAVKRRSTLCSEEGHEQTNGTQPPFRLLARAGSPIPGGQSEFAATRNQGVDAGQTVESRSPYTSCRAETTRLCERDFFADTPAFTLIASAPSHGRSC